MNTKYIVEELSKIQSLIEAFDSNPLPFFDGKTISLMKFSTYTNAVEIQNPSHPDFGKYYIGVKEMDADAIAPLETLVDKDPNWHINEES